MWPPIWVGIGATQGKNARGEVGRLQQVRFYPDRPRRIFLTMDYDGAEYTGALLFSDNVSCDKLCKLLQGHCGLLIIEIGDLDVPLDLDLLGRYRRASACQTWHFCSNCSHWPEDKYQELATEPETGELCNECKALREQQNCQ